MAERHDNYHAVGELRIEDLVDHTESDVDGYRRDTEVRGLGACVDDYSGPEVSRAHCGRSGWFSRRALSGRRVCAQLKERSSHGSRRQLRG